MLLEQILNDDLTILSRQEATKPISWESSNYLISFLDEDAKCSRNSMTKYSCLCSWTKVRLTLERMQVLMDGSKGILKLVMFAPNSIFNPWWTLIWSKFISSAINLRQICKIICIDFRVLQRNPRSTFFLKIIESSLSSKSTFWTLLLQTATNRLDNHVSKMIMESSVPGLRVPR